MGVREMVKPIFLSINNEFIYEMIKSAEKSIYLAIPGISKKIADALVDACNRFGGWNNINVVLDSSPKVYYIGFAEYEGYKNLKESGCTIRGEDGLRIGLLIIDEEVYIFSPSSLILESDQENSYNTNALALQQEISNSIIESVIPKNNSEKPVIGKKEISEAKNQMIQNAILSDPPAKPADILALSALYLGKKIIVVGDDEQVSPESVGIKVDEISALAEQYLQEIPNNHLYGGKTSIYDMAKTSGFKPIMLVEHFRCLPEIIEFSNRLSYNGKIKPLRAVMGTSLKPSVVEYRVANGMRNEKKVNYEEVEHITSLICACIEDKAYANKTIGVISLLGHDQAYEIDKLLQRRLDPKEYESRKIQCGRPSQFQGDERDIIFLSIVDSPKEGGGPLRLVSEDGNNDIYRKRYNVAASRAKDQMWVVHSLNPEIDLQPDDIRLRLIKFAMDPNANKDDELLNNTESDFEERVMKKLLNKGYKVYPQWKVGAYRIDLVVEDKNKVIAVECDGEKWYTQDDLPNDLKRQAILERLGWKFIRIRGSEFYRDSESTMDRVYVELENNGIKPSFLSEDQSDVLNQNSENQLLDRIKIQAESIRNSWNGKDNNIENHVNEEKHDSDNRSQTINIDVSIKKSTILKNKKENEKKKIDPLKAEKVIKKEEIVLKPLFDFRNKK